MKIEKINDNQVRCTLSREDLLQRKMHLTELAYGSPKARELFNEMMERAYDEFGFDADGYPIMVEAVPMPGEDIVLIVSKVDDPDELDTRFSRFTTPPAAQEQPEGEGLEDLLGLFRKLSETVQAAETAQENKEEEKTEPEVPRDLTRVVSFPSLDDASAVCRVLAPFYKGESALYKDADGRICLTVTRMDSDAEAFGKAVNLLSEYGTPLRRGDGAEAFLREHARCLIPSGAVEKLARI